ncbi:hypothetical protein [Nocardioides sp. Iso805N]|uniref:hypothetical protein n=1 Tax=Nocardioides sp. Iso805N TaxID=1283287 RepID=UPI0003608584|nr:hypothetical protein [Nocardioides sp. Iso805N]
MLVVVPALVLPSAGGAGLTVAYVAYVVVVVLLFIAIAVATGPRPRWRWGTSPGDDPHEDF